ncbi:MAG: CobD/CbiB family protein [Sulfuriferula sp.]
MTFFALLAAILFEHFYPLPQHQPAILIRAMHYLAHQMNAGKPQYGMLAWLIIILPLLLATSLIYFALSGISLWLAWLWNIAVLYLCIRFKTSFLAAEHIHRSLLCKDLPVAQQLFTQWRGTEALLTDADDLSRLNIEAVFTDALQHLFGVIFWFVLLSPLGPVGAVLYRTTESLAKHWQVSTHGAFAVFPQYMNVLADWLPARATALSFAIAGNFEDSLYCWRSQAIHWPDHNQGILLASGAGALGVKLGMPLHQGAIWRPELGLGERADNSYFGSTLSLIWRALVIWFFLLLLMALAKLAR